MPIRYERIALDVRPCGKPTPPTVCGRQGDEGTVLEVAVTSGGRPMDLDGLTATLLGNNPELLQLAGSVSGGTATFALPSPFFSAVGAVDLYVRLEQGDDVVASTQSFALKVEPAADLSASQAEGYVGRIDEALEVAERASQTAQAAAEQAEGAVKGAELAAEKANGAASGATSAAQTAKSSASSANAAADKASSAAQVALDAASEARSAAESASSAASSANAASDSANAAAQAATSAAGSANSAAESANAAASNATSTASAASAAASKAEGAAEVATGAASSANAAAASAESAASSASDAADNADAAADKANAAADYANARACNYLRGEESGALIHVEDAWPSPVRGLKVYGKSEQASTTGKNLLDVDTESSAFVSATTGELIAAATGTFHPSQYIVVTAGESYTYSNTPTGTSAGYAWYDSEKAFISGASFLGGGTTVIITAPNNAAYLRASVRHDNIGNAQLELGSNATSYEPYTGGKPSPNPEYPQEIKSIADVDVVATGRCIAEPVITNTSSAYTTCLYANGNLESFAGKTIYVSFIAANGFKGYFNENITKSWVAFSSTGQRQTLAITLVDSLNTSNTAQYAANAGWILLKSSGSNTINSNLTDVCIEVTDSGKYAPYLGATTPNLLVSEDGTAYELRSLPDGTRDEVGIVDGRWVLDLVTDITVATKCTSVDTLDNGNKYAIISAGEFPSESSDFGGYMAVLSDKYITSASKDDLTCYKSWNATVVIDNRFTDVGTANAILAEEQPVFFTRTPNPKTIDLGPVDTPLLPETVSNVWPVSEPSTELAMTYERDVTVAYNNLEQAIASMTA